MTSSILSELEEFHGKFYPRVYKGVVPVGPERISLESSYLEAWREDGWWGGVGSYCWEIIPNQSCQIKNFWKQFCVSLDMHWTLNPLCSATCSGAKTLFICMRYDIEVFVTDLLMGGRGGSQKMTYSTTFIAKLLKIASAPKCWPEFLEDILRRERHNIYGRFPGRKLGPFSKLLWRRLIVKYDSVGQDRFRKNHAI